MHKIFSVLALSFALAAPLAGAQTASYDGVRQDLIIDVRTPAEFSAGHIAGAVNIPFDRIQSGSEATKNIDKNGRILIYCRSGRRSALAKDLLEKQGFRQVHDGGGMNTVQPRVKVCYSQYC